MFEPAMEPRPSNVLSWRAATLTVVPPDVAPVWRVVVGVADQVTACGAVLFTHGDAAYDGAVAAMATTGTLQAAPRTRLRRDGVDDSDI